MKSSSKGANPNDVSFGESMKVSNLTREAMHGKLKKTTVNANIALETSKIHPYNDTVNQT